jgi:predicted metal-binding membrane protein
MRMGLRYAGLCAACSWPLFVLLFPVGVMNIAAMLLVTALIVVARMAPRGIDIARVAGLALVGFGVAVVIDPALLPTQLGMTMDAGM